jgi:hypothetical protein
LESNALDSLDGRYAVVSMVMLPITDATQGQSRLQSSSCCPEAPRKLEPVNRRPIQPKKRRPFARIGRYLGLITARRRNAPQFWPRWLRGFYQVARCVTAREKLELATPLVRYSVSFPAKAGNPVRCGFSAKSLLSLEYWVVRSSRTTTVSCVASVRAT